MGLIAPNVMEASAQPDEVIRSDSVADQPDAKAAKAGGSGKKTIRVAYPHSEFHHSVKGAESPITAAGVEVDASKVKALIEAAATVDTRLEEVSTDGS
jgi:hypothetical protein